jgi:hypothetical protein
MFWLKCLCLILLIFSLGVNVVLFFTLSYFFLCRVRLTIGVEDQTGYTLFHAFDHVMIDIANVDAHVKVSTSLAGHCLVAF